MSVCHAQLIFNVCAIRPGLTVTLIKRLYLPTYVPMSVCHAQLIFNVCAIRPGLTITLIKRLYLGPSVQCKSYGMVAPELYHHFYNFSGKTVIDSRMKLSHSIKDLSVQSKFDFHDCK